MLGSGLVIITKFPIIATNYHRFALNGYPLKLLHGDYYVGKGVGSVLVDHPKLGLLQIFNTHLHGGYGPKDRYKAHRATECWQLVHLLRNSAAMGRHILLVIHITRKTTKRKLMLRYSLVISTVFLIHSITI